MMAEHRKIGIREARKRLAEVIEDREAFETVVALFEAADDQAERAMEQAERALALLEHERERSLAMLTHERERSVHWLDYARGKHRGDLVKTLEMATKGIRSGDAIYPNGFRWAREDMFCLQIARDWHNGQDTALYALACGDFSPETVVKAKRELGRGLAWGRDTFTDDETIEGELAYSELTRWADGVSDLTEGAPITTQEE